MVAVGFSGEGRPITEEPMSKMSKSEVMCTLLVRNHGVTLQSCALAC